MPRARSLALLALAVAAAAAGGAPAHAARLPSWSGTVAMSQVVDSTLVEPGNSVRNTINDRTTITSDGTSSAGTGFGSIDHLGSTARYGGCGPEGTEGPITSTLSGSGAGQGRIVVAIADGAYDLGAALDTALSLHRTESCAGFRESDEVGGAFAIGIGNSGSLMPLPAGWDGDTLRGSRSWDPHDYVGTHTITITWSLTELSDRDRDGFPDGADKCPDTWASPDSKDGCPTKPTCSDGFDNDGDGTIDFPADPSCASAAGDEGRPQCGDKADNDGDGHVDYPMDPGCASASDPTEQDPCPRSGYARPEYQGGWRNREPETLYDVTIRWCEENGRIRLIDADADATETGTESSWQRLERAARGGEFGYKLEWHDRYHGTAAGADTKPTVEQLPGGKLRVIAASGAWKVCLDTLALLPLFRGLHRLIGVTGDLVKKIPGISGFLERLAGRSPAVKQLLEDLARAWRGRALTAWQRALAKYVSKQGAEFRLSRITRILETITRQPRGAAFKAALRRAGLDAEANRYEVVLAARIQARRRTLGRVLTARELQELQSTVQREFVTRIKAELFAEKFPPERLAYEADLRKSLEKKLDEGSESSLDYLADRLGIEGFSICRTIWTPKIVTLVRPGAGALSFENGTHSRAWEVDETH